MKTTCLLALVFALTIWGVSFAYAETPEAKQAFRIIPIHQEKHDYSRFSSIVIRSQEEWDSFLSGLSGSPLSGPSIKEKNTAWDREDYFLKTIEEAKLDFDNEALVLIRITEPSGSIQVKFGEPRLDSFTLICPIKRELPGLTDDMAYHCFALAVSKTQVKRVQVLIQSEESYYL